MKKQSKKLSARGNPPQVDGADPGESITPAAPPPGVYVNPKRAAEARPIPNAGAAIRDLMAQPPPGAADNARVLDQLAAHHNLPLRGGR
jgi:hypothetical protein